MDTDVIVVGAGAAGIAAALWLAERSVRVVVREGHERPGEPGAKFIHGDAPETAAFLRLCERYRSRRPAPQRHVR